MKIRVTINEAGKKFAETKNGLAPLFIKRGAGANVNANGVITADPANVCVDSYKGHPCKVTVYKVDNFERETLKVADFFDIEG